MRREDPVAQEPDALGAWEDHALVAVDLEPEAGEKALDLAPDLVQPSLVVGKESKSSTYRT